MISNKKQKADATEAGGHEAVGTPHEIRHNPTTELAQVTDVTEEDFERTEGEEENLYNKFMEMAGWKVTDKELDHDLT
jgi:hypothetical protein